MRGLDLRRAGRSADALALFRRAYEVAPSPRTLGQMGLVESSLQLWADAEAHLLAVLATPEDAWVHRNRQFLEQARERTKEHMGELLITGPPGTKVSLGERRVGSLPLAAPVRLAEGDVVISATSDGYKPFSVDLSIKGGARAPSRSCSNESIVAAQSRQSGFRIERSIANAPATLDGDDPRGRRSRRPGLGNRLESRWTAGATVAAANRPAARPPTTRNARDLARCRRRRFGLGGRRPPVFGPSSGAFERNIGVHDALVAIEAHFELRGIGRDQRGRMRVGGRAQNTEYWPGGNGRIRNRLFETTPDRSL